MQERIVGNEITGKAATSECCSAAIIAVIDIVGNVSTVDHMYCDSCKRLIDTNTGKTIPDEFNNEF